MPVLVALFAILFVVCGLALWFAPEQTAQLMRIESVGVEGLVTLRADLAGLFLGMGVLCLAGIIRRYRPLLVAAATVLACIAVGRVLGMIVDGFTVRHVGFLAAELAAIGTLLVAARGPRSPGKPALARPGRTPLLLTGGLSAALIAVAWALLDPRIEQWIFDEAAARLTAPPDERLLESDALRVGICGSSAPLPSAKRAKACVAVFAGGKYYLVDVGPESVESLSLWGIPMQRIGGVLLTHFHSDHIGDLGELNLQTWVQGRPAPMAVYGGPGVDRVVNGFNEAYRLDQGYRTAHHTAQLMPAETWPMVAHPIELVGPPTEALSRTGLVLEDGDLRITAIEVDHDPIRPAYAYRFDYKDRSVVVTGDLKFHPPLADGARGADLLASEAISRPMVAALERGAARSGRDRVAKIMHDVQDYHISPVEAADIANRAGVKLLVFYHLLPSPDSFLTRRLFGRDMDRARNGEWTIAEDGSLYTLPVGSDAIRIGRADG